MDKQLTFPAHLLITTSAEGIAVESYKSNGERMHATIRAELARRVAAGEDRALATAAILAEINYLGTEE